MDIKQIISTLENAPRYYNPTLGNTVVITDDMAREIIKQMKIRRSRKVPQTVGAQPA